MKLLFSILYPKPELRATIKEIETNEWTTQAFELDSYKWENVVKNTVFHGNNAGDVRAGDSESMDVCMANKTTNNNNNKNQQQEMATNNNHLMSIQSTAIHSKSF